MSKDIQFLRQLKRQIDSHLESAEANEEPIPMIVQSSQPVYTQLSELSRELREDYANADKEVKKIMEKKFNLKPSGDE